MERKPALTPFGVIEGAPSAPARFPGIYRPGIEPPRSAVHHDAADATDFYMFNSYEGVASNGIGGRAGFVTLIANYLPLQDPYGGPNYFSLDPNALYEIHIDNNGDAKEDITFQFKFKNSLKSIALPIVDKMVPIPLIQAGTVTDRKSASLTTASSPTT